MININHFAEAIGKTVGITTEQTNEVIKLIVEQIVRGVDSDETMNITGLGRFNKIIRKGRVCRHPITGQSIRWKDTPGVKYHPANRFKKTIRDGG